MTGRIDPELTMNERMIQGFEAEDYLEASDGLKLHYYRRILDQPRYQIIAVHGLGEHAGRYAWFADQIAEDGGNFSVLDLRGHGRSEGSRGHSPSYNQLISDIEAFASIVKLENIPAFLMGHSLGGGLCLNYGLRQALEAENHTTFDGYIACSPLLRLSFQPPPWKLFLARKLVKLWPSFSLDRGINPRVLTRDKDISAAYLEDPLNHEMVSASLTLGFLEAGQFALDHANELLSPALVLHGGDDQVTDIEASKVFANSAGDHASFKGFPGCYHELINDIDRNEVTETIKSWINSQI